MKADLRQQVVSAPTLKGDYLAKLLSRLVAVRSVNGEHDEAEIAQLIAERLRRIGCHVEFVYPKPGRPSVGARLVGEGAGNGSVVLNGHLDTVPVDVTSQWTVDPFAGTIREDFVWGRGACDMKGGLATQVAVAEFMASRRHAFGGTLLLHFAMGEERGEPGTLALLDAGFTADYGITTEPTSLRLGIAERGLVTFRIVIHGRSSHASAPDLGNNPIRYLPPLLQALESENSRLQSITHPLLGNATMTPTHIRAGTFASVIPDRCDVLVDRRLLPGESADMALQECQKIVRTVVPRGNWEIEIEASEGIYEAAETPAHAEIVKRMQEAITAIRGSPAPLYGTPYASDVRNLINDAGIQSITFGAGDIEWMHCVDERLSIASLETAAHCIAYFAADTLGPADIDKASLME